MTSALILGGGGSRGAYPIGVLRVLAESTSYAAYHGTSVGAINAAGLAQCATTRDGVRRLAAQWTDLATGEVMQRHALPHALVTEGALYSTEPLRRMLAARLAERPLLHPCIAWAADLATGTNARLALNGQPIARQVDMLRASAAFPGAMPAIALDGSWFFDGGLCAVVPLADALLECEGFERVDVVLCADPHAPLEPVHPDTLSGLDRAMRAVEVATHRQAAYDLLTARDVWRSMLARPEVRLWWPRVQHCPDPMQFVPSQIDAAMRQGVSDARDAREVWR